MKRNISRREFVKQCAVSGSAILTAPSLSEALLQTTQPRRIELCTVTGDQYFDNTIKAVEALGGMNRFVKQGNTVGVLINASFDRQGSYTNPDVVLAVVRMCLDAGAKEIQAICNTSRNYWKRGTMQEKMKSEIDAIRPPDDMTLATIPAAVSLKTANVTKSLLNCDVFINLPIIKDHKGTRFTCNMKNMMGACSSSTCRYFHLGGKFSLFGGYYNNLQLLAQCIADINLLRRPTLSVVDATEFLVTNGPSGPGDIKKPREIIASTDCVAADMYSVRHLGLNWEELPVFKFAQQHGYGPDNLSNVSVKTL
jgi:uncharacterized protein (DUF362 family)